MAFIHNFAAVEIKVINTSKNPLPEAKTEASSGLDLRADLETSFSLEPGKIKLVPTGLSIEIPEGYEGQVRPRSGLAAKHGITVLNAPGTIDADYRGEVKVILINHSEEEFLIEPGDRIAQLVINKFEPVHWLESNELSETSRSDGGFGSTGKK